MAELSDREKIAFHEFSVRYRATYAKMHPTPQERIDAIRDAIWGDYEQQMQRERNSGIGPPNPSPNREPEEPDR